MFRNLLWSPRWVRGFWLLALLLAALPNESSAAEAPRLVVVVSIDQFPFEYLMRLWQHLEPEGFFRTVWKDGAAYTACHHGHAFTITAPGHSVMLTGAFPNTTGIVDNDWFDRDSGRTVYCVEDESVRNVGAPGSKSMSPRNLQVGTLGDSIKLSSNGRGKVFGVALKDRASILMAGHAADAAFWYDNNSGNWITSTYYREALPDYLQAYNVSGSAKRYGGREWRLLHDQDKYELYYPDNAPWESNPASIGRSFPRTFPKADDPGYNKLLALGPFGNEMTLQIARLVLTEERLGSDDDADLLCVNLSSNDYVGHAFGPYSLEAQDMTYRTDRMLADFTKFLNKEVGVGRWTLALTSDHGVAPIPEHAAKMRLPARRVPAEHFATLRETLEKALTERFGKPQQTGAKYILHFDSNMVYLNEDLAELGDERRVAAQRIVRETLLRDAAVAAAFTRSELVDGGSQTELFRRVELSFHPRRSGDVLFALKPYHIAGDITATHGSPWEYDTHVPLLWLGAGVKPSIVDRPVVVPQLAPTAARILGIAFPSGCTVEPLYDILQTAP
jgi:predicted AlkP superfamily pyrophosphatase or phosphodiesterase